MQRPPVVRLRTNQSARHRPSGCPARSPELGSTAAHRDVAAQVTVVGPAHRARSSSAHGSAARARGLPPAPTSAISSCRDPPPSPPLIPTPLSRRSCACRCPAASVAHLGVRCVVRGLGGCRITTGWRCSQRSSTSPSRRWWLGSGRTCWATSIPPSSLRTATRPAASCSSWPMLSPSAAEMCCRHRLGSGTSRSVGHCHHRARYVGVDIARADL